MIINETNGIKEMTRYNVDLSQKDGMKRMVQCLEENGLVIFDQPMSREELVNFSLQFGDIYVHRDADQDGVTQVANTGTHEEQSGYLGLTASALTLHTDRSGVEDAPNLLVFYCVEQAEKGGESLMLDGKELYQYLQLEHPDVLQKISAVGSVIYGGGQAPVNTRVFSELEDGQQIIKFRYDSLGYFSAPMLEAMPTFLNALETLSFTFRLQPNQGYIIKNDRFLHGRTSFAGRREMMRVLVDSTPESKYGLSIKRGFSI